MLKMDLFIIKTVRTKFMYLFVSNAIHMKNYFFLETFYLRLGEFFIKKVYNGAIPLESTDGGETKIGRGIGLLLNFKIKGSFLRATYRDCKIT